MRPLAQPRECLPAAYPCPLAPLQGGGQANHEAIGGHDHCGAAELVFTVTVQRRLPMLQTAVRIASVVQRRLDALRVGAWSRPASAGPGGAAGAPPVWPSRGLYPISFWA